MPKRHKAGQVRPAYFAWIRFKRSCFDRLNQNVKMSSQLAGSEFATRACLRLLHHHCQIFQLVLKNRQGAPGHLDAASRIQRCLG